MSNALTIVGSRGEALYQTPASNPSKYRPARRIHRDPKRNISQMDHATIVQHSTQIACQIPILSGALRQMSEWAFAGDSWHPIHYGANEAWGDIAASWLQNTVYKSCVNRTTNKKLIKAMQVSAKSWLTQGDDLALFSLDSNKMPTMTIVPATAIGNGDPKNKWWSNDTLTSDSATTPQGYGVCAGGKFDGYRIYNGIIYDDQDEPIAARVLGWKLDGKTWVQTYADFMLGFQHGAHLASPYDWHGMGRSLPRLASAVPAWLDFCETDDHLKKGIKLAATKMIIHQLAAGQDAPQARGDAVQQIETTDNDGNPQTIWVESTDGGDVTYIGSGEQLAGADFQNPHPNVEEFITRKLRENVFDLGWLFELIDLSSTGRAPTRLGCELVNNSIWQLQTDGEERMEWFTRFAVAAGIEHGHLPNPGDGAMDDPYLWTFGYPKEMSVDAGNDVTASLNRIRFGLTSQRVESAKWGYVLKRIRRDRQKEAMMLVEDADEMTKFAAAKGHDLPFIKAMEYFYMPSQSPAQIPQAPAQPQTSNQPPAKAE